MTRSPFERPAPALGSVAPPPARVLVVDDEPSVVDVFREFLTSQGYDLSVATSGEEAVALIPDVRPDLILTDVNLPGLSGLEVMRFAKQADPDACVIVVTGYATASTAIEALRQGAYDYVKKPFDLDEVHRSAERGLADRRLKTQNRELLEQLRQKNEILQDHEQQLRERVRVATLQMTTLYEVGKQIGTNLELGPRLALISAKAAEITQAEAAVIYLRREESDQFRAAAAHGLELPEANPEATHYLSAEGAVGLSAFERRPIRRRVTDDLAVSFPGVSGVPCGGVLALPLIAETQVIGVLAVMRNGRDFTDVDESFLALFASQAAGAIRNSQLFEHTKSLDRLKSEFVAVVSHEIRTPLTSVKGAVELLGDERYFTNNEQQSKLLSIAHANAERLLVLISDILDFSKLDSASLPMNIEHQRLEPVVLQATHNIRTLIEERRIQIEVVLSPDLPDVLLDSNRITQVLINLLSNAIKFSPLGGQIKVAAEPWEGSVRVAVSDHGEGIASQDLPKLFRKFSQIDSGSTRKVGGTGLGLVICKGIVEQHGGRIWVESTPHVGSTFFFTLPVTAREGAAVTAAS
ncbi:MAG TPA: ATP-binding protein [Candidatus Limnocylindria bacterium]|nr:ATP-binding protein [Candidatus Limnocylindria bacterium]